MTVVSHFCQNYPAARVKPSPEELQQLWLKCHLLQQGAVSSSLYDELSFANCDPSWQPRLRALHAIDHFARQEKGKEIAILVTSNALELIKHLMTVEKCKDMAKKVLRLLPDDESGLTGDVADDEQEAPPDVRPVAVKKEPVSDLLDFSSPAPAASPAPKAAAAPAAAAPAAKGAGLLDDLLLMGEPIQKAPEPSVHGLGDLTFLDVPVNAKPHAATNDLDLLFMNEPVKPAAAQAHAELLPF